MRPEKIKVRVENGENKDIKIELNTVGGERKQTETFKYRRNIYDM